MRGQYTVNGVQFPEMDYITAVMCAKKLEELNVGLKVGKVVMK